MNEIPVIIPLGNGSIKEDWELRILLRSIEKHLEGHGRIYLATMHCPNWLNDAMIEVVPLDDPYSSNKDANLHYKTMTVIERFNLDEFIFCADDNVFLRDVEARGIPVLYNPRGREAFQQGNGWGARVRHTLEWAESKGMHLAWNYECHAHQVFCGKRILKRLKKEDYASQPGLTIYTTWRVLEGVNWGLPQSDHKWTFQGDCSIMDFSDDALCSREFLGYNDAAVAGGIIQRLRKMFPEKSIYEKEDSL